MTLEQVVPWGRNFDEYRQMFNLECDGFNGTVLGVSDGPSSFNAEATQKGCRVTSIDPVYTFSKNQISGRIQETARIIMQQIEQSRDAFIWSTLASPQVLETVRMHAMETFLEDFEQGKAQKRYVEGALPQLPFESQSFDLVLCSHFLFLYSSHFDTQFHIQSVLELARIGKEVRIFPLVDLNGLLSVHLEQSIEALGQNGFTATIENSHYEFQRGAHQMLRIVSREPV